MTNPIYDNDIELIKDLPQDHDKALAQIASKVNELVRSANKNHGKPYKVINGKADFLMNNKTNDQESAVLRFSLNPAIPVTRPTGVFIALFTSDPGEAGVITAEVSTSGTGYTRTSAFFDTPTNGFTINVDTIQFPTSLASWGNITHIGICRGNTPGVQDLMYYGPLVTPINVNAANFSPQFAPGTLTVSEKALIAGLSAIFQGNGSFTGNFSPTSDLNVTTEQDYVPRASKVTLPLIIIDVKDSYPGSVNVDLTDTGNTATNATNLRNALNASLTSLTHTRIRLPNNWTAVFSTPLEPSGPHTNPGIWTTIEWINKPTAGVRVSPSVMANSPKFITSAVSPVFLMQNGEDRIRLIGITMYTTTTNNFGLVRQGQGETTLAAIPNGMIIDRCYIHGNGLQCQHGVILNGTYGSVINCYIDDIHWVGTETQSVVGWAGPGPFRIDNNFLFGYSIGVLFGGAETTIVGLHPSDILVRRNECYKTETLRGTSNVPKNSYELKHAQRVLFEGNAAINSWPEGQNGSLFLIQSLGGSWTETKDVTIRYNIGSYGNLFANLVARGSGSTAVNPTNRFDINNNLAVNLANASSYRAMQLIGDLNTFYIEHNTLIGNLGYTGVPFVFDLGGGPQASNIKIRNNIIGPVIPTTLSTVLLSGDGAGSSAMNGYGGPTSEFKNNIGFMEPVPGSYLAGDNNQFAARAPAIQFKSDWSLKSTSPYKGIASDGGDPGAFIPDVLLATSGVVPCIINTTTGVIATASMAKPAYQTESIEPDFKTFFRRITPDVGATVPVIGGTVGNVFYHNYAKDQVFNADQTLLCLKQTSGAFGAGVFAILDAQTYDPVYTRNGGTQGGGESRWHPTLADKMIIINSDGTVKHWDIPTNTSTVKFAADPLYNNCEFGPFEGNPSYSGDKICMKAVKVAGGNIVGRVITGLNGGSPTAGPVIDLTAAGVGSLDWVSISAGGAYVVAFGDFGGSQRTRVWNSTTGALVQSWDTDNFGHADLGIDDNGNEVMFGAFANGTHTKRAAMRQLSNGTITDLSGPNTVSFSWHASTRNFNRPGWGYISVNDSTGVTYDGEIIAVKLSSSNQVERYGHHRTLNNDYDSAVFACPSPDGKRIIFASTFGAAGTPSRPVQCYVLDSRTICP